MGGFAIAAAMFAGLAVIIASVAIDVARSKVKRNKARASAKSRRPRFSGKGFAKAPGQGPEDLACRKAKAKDGRRGSGRRASHLSARQQALLAQKLRDRRERDLYLAQQQKEIFDNSFDINLTLKENPGFYMHPGNDYYIIMEDENNYMHPDNVDCFITEDENK